MSTHLGRALNSDHLAAIEDYRQRLAREYPDIQILSVALKDGAIDIRLSDNADRDMATFERTTELAIEVEDDHPGVCLLPRTVPHAE